MWIETALGCYIASPQWKETLHGEIVVAIGYRFGLALRLKD
jgi:hypothetical protein